MEPRVYLKDVVSVQVERGCFLLKYKTSHVQEGYESLDFLQLKILKSQEFPEPKQRTQPRGIDHERKAAIVSKLVPLMPANRREFWYNLPVSSDCDD